MPVVLDQMGRSVEVPTAPQRIVSLVPSQTELLYDLGIEDRVVGVTKFCIHPKSWRSEKAIVGGTKQYHVDKIRALRPDLIIGNKEENEQTAIEELAAEFPVWMSDIGSLEDGVEMIKSVGQLVNRDNEAIVLAKDIQEGFNGLYHSSPLPSALYLIWKDPYMAVGTQTFINQMMLYAGFENCLTESRYPSLTFEQITELNPEYILLSSEPYPFRDKHISELDKVLPKTKVLLVDGELFSWYGSRLLKSPQYFKALRNYN